MATYLRIFLTQQFNDLYVVNPSEAIKLLEEGEDIDAIFDDGLTALHIAALRNDNRLVEFFLSKGADITLSSTGGLTALTRAARFGFIEVIRTILQSIDDVSLSSQCYYEVLMYACATGNVNIVKCLLEEFRCTRSNYDGDANQTRVLAYAVLGGYNEIVNLLLQNAEFKFELQTKFEMLRYAAYYNQHVVVAKSIITNIIDTASGAEGIIDKSDMAKELVRSIEEIIFIENPEVNDYIELILKHVDVKPFISKIIKNNSNNVSLNNIKFSQFKLFVESHFSDNFTQLTGICKDIAEDDQNGALNELHMSMLPSEILSYIFQNLKLSDVKSKLNDSSTKHWFHDLSESVQELVFNCILNQLAFDAFKQTFDPVLQELIFIHSQLEIEDSQQESITSAGDDLVLHSELI